MLNNFKKTIDFSYYNFSSSLSVSTPLLLILSGFKNFYKKLYYYNNKK